MNKQWADGLSFKFQLIFILLSLSSYCHAAGDSGVIQAPPITNTVVQTPDATVAAPASADGLLPCPSEIKDCPDINGKGGNSVTCPDNCTVNRFLQLNESYTPLTDGWVPPVIKITPAACPAGYTAGKQYTVAGVDDKEYAFATPPGKTNIDFIRYFTILQPLNICGPTGETKTTTTGNAFNCSGPDLSWAVNGAPIAGIVAGATEEGFNMIYITGAVYTFTNCAGSCMGGCIRGTLWSTDHYNYNYTKMECTPKPGYYATGNTTTTHEICSRTKVQWRVLKE